MNWKDELKNMMNEKSVIRFEENEENKEAKLYIYGVIGSWLDNNEDLDIKRKLNQIDADTIHVHINSPGGSAFDGVAISNMLRNHSAEIVVHIDGWAASAASVIAMSGDKIIMPENTMMMIHRASTIGIGNAADFEKTAKDLRKVDAALSASYKKRFVGEDSELQNLLDDETFLTANEAVALGLADEISDEIEIPNTENEYDEHAEEDYEDLKEALVAKYKNKNNKVESKGPTQNNLSKLFFNL